MGNSPGMLWNQSPGSYATGYRRLPGGDWVPPKYFEAADAAGCGIDFSTMQRRDWSSAPVVGTNRFVTSDPVPLGAYWWIMLMSCIDTSATTHAIGFFYLAPDGFPVVQGPSLAHESVKGAIRIGSGQLGNLTGLSSQGSEVSPLFADRIIVPSGFRILAQEEDVADGVSGLLMLRAAFMELQNGTNPPSF